MKKGTILVGTAVITAMLMISGCGSSVSSAPAASQTETVAAQSEQLDAVAAKTEQEETLISQIEETDTAAAQTAQEITDAQALDIALAAAGMKKTEITGERVEMEFEDDYGKTIYDVEFHVGKTEYSYDIDPETGNILSYDIDTDDD